VNTPLSPRERHFCEIAVYVAWIVTIAATIAIL
jgi:hypothetical protein